MSPKVELNFSARAHDRILKVARTLADLAGKQDIGGNEVLEATGARLRVLPQCHNVGLQSAKT